MSFNQLLWKKEKEVKSTLDYLKNSGFASIIDADDIFSNNAILYYCHFGKGSYIVLNHYNRKKKIELQGFDLWVCQYSGNNEPGRGCPLSMKSIKHGFVYPKHLDILDKLLRTLKE